MSNTEPILKRIHDRFDVYERYSHTDHSFISGINISERPDGYRLIAFPGGYGSYSEGLAIDVKSKGGIFTDRTPYAAETSRDARGLMYFTSDEYVKDDGLVIIIGNALSPDAQERLVLPGEAGFELIEELHEQIQTYRNALSNAVNIAGIHLKPRSFTYQDSDGGTISYDRDANTATHYRSTSLGVTDGETEAKIELDGTVETELHAKPCDMNEYRSGTLELNDNSYLLSTDALVAFNGFRNAIKNIYQ